MVVEEAVEEEEASAVAEEHQEALAVVEEHLEASVVEEVLLVELQEADSDSCHARI